MMQRNQEINSTQDKINDILENGNESEYTDGTNRFQILEGLNYQLKQALNVPSKIEQRSQAYHALEKKVETQELKYANFLKKYGITAEEHNKIRNEKGCGTLKEEVENIKKYLKKQKK